MMADRTLEAAEHEAEESETEEREAAKHEAAEREAEGHVTEWRVNAERDAAVYKAAERVTLEEAAALLLKFLTPVEETEDMPILSCSGRILAEDVTAVADNPPFNRSPVDGYACRSEDLTGASPEFPAVLSVVEEIDAGMWPEHSIGAGEAARIMTGAPIPEGADCCVYQERTDYGETRVKIYTPCRAYENFCFQGEDMKAGETVLRKGTRITYAEIGILAGLGRNKASVYRKTRAAVFASGDELSEPGAPLLPGKIYDNNLYFLSARLEELGVSVTAMKRIPDREEQMAEVLREAAAACDLIVTTGGVSVGKRDIMHGSLERAGAKRLFWKILMKPGMPTIGSVLEGTPVISLSGNPFGALADFELLVRPMLAAAGRNSGLKAVETTAVLAEPFPKFSPSRRFLRGTLENGRVSLPAVEKHSSGILSSMSGCNCLIEIPAGTPQMAAGETVKVFLL